MRDIDEVFLKIHNAVHNNSNVIISNIQLECLKYKNGCNYIEYAECKFMEQNKNSDSLFAKKAINGEKITWIIPNDNSPYLKCWGLIENGIIKRKPKLNKPKNANENTLHETSNAGKNLY